MQQICQTCNNIKGQDLRRTHTHTPSRIIHHTVTLFLKMQPFQWDINNHQR